MPPTKKNTPSASASKGLKSKDRTTPYSKGVRGDPSGGNKKSHATHSNKPRKAWKSHQSLNLTTELDSLLDDLNSQLHGEKTKRAKESEMKRSEAQAKHESLQSDMMSALDGISTLGK
ncbi:hypothetical protein BGX31_003019 [Mortierella sp. GBA43]|nr:hypothetical protein BGX31_003019 [Mortierella sp. GBA43]